jgi:hypothetical protein
MSAAVAPDLLGFHWANVCGRVANPAGSGSCAEFQSVSLNLLRLRTLTRLDFGRSVTSEIKRKRGAPRF